MTKKEFKKLVKEHFTGNYYKGKVVDIEVWSTGADYLYQILVLSGHTVSKYHGWLEDEVEGTLKVIYNGCL